MAKTHEELLLKVKSEIQHNISPVIGWLRLGGLTPLWTSNYGRVLLIKVSLLLGVAATGAYNWLRVKPALGTSESTARLKKSATVELVLGTVVIAATAILVALPAPIDG